MRQVSLEKTDLASCVSRAQREPVVVTRNRKPVALIVRLDVEQVELGSNDRFWKLIASRRRQQTISRDKLEQMLAPKK